MISPEQRERRDLTDLQHLVAQEQFTRFLLRVIQEARIFSPTTDGSREQHLLNEGARQLGLKLLSWAEAAQPAAHPDLPIFTILQVCREEATQPQQEPNHEKRKDRYDRNAEFDDPDPDDDDRS